MSRVQKAVGYLERRYRDTQGGFMTDVEVDRYHLRTALDRLALLEELTKEVPVYVGDTVRDLHDDEPTGIVLSVETVRDIVVYEVKLFREYANLKTINYYREEFDLVERAK